LSLSCLALQLVPPTTQQLNIVVAGLWGVAYFKEVENERLVMVFAAAVAIELGGAALIALVH
jgi:hypothetical protein